jgi:hypothetical protein
MVIGIKTKKMEKVLWNIRMEIYLKEVGETVWDGDKVFIRITTEISIMACGLMIKNRAKEL